MCCSCMGLWVKSGAPFCTEKDDVFFLLFFLLPILWSIIVECAALLPPFFGYKKDRKSDEKTQKSAKKVVQKWTKKWSKSGQKWSKNHFFWCRKTVKHPPKSDILYLVADGSKKGPFFGCFSVFLDLQIVPKVYIQTLQFGQSAKKGPKTALFGVILGHFGPFWPFLALFGPFWPFFGSFLDPFWIKYTSYFDSGPKVTKKHEKTEKTPKKGHFGIWPH